MYTKDDYFDTDSYGMSHADYTAIQYRDNAVYQLDNVLDLIGCKRDTSYDYEPNSFGGHIKAKPHACMSWPYPAEYVDQHSFTPTWIRDDMFKYGPDVFEMDMRDAWNSRYDLLDQLFNLLVRYDGRCNCNYWTYYEDLSAKDQRAIDRYCAIRDRYNAEIQKALDEICRIAEEEIDGDYEFSETDECAQMWAEDMNDWVRWRNREALEAAFENMVGMTAAYDGYAA